MGRVRFRIGRADKEDCDDDVEAVGEVHGDLVDASALASLTSRGVMVMIGDGELFSSNWP